QHARYRQERVVLLRVAAANHSLPAFTLEWEAQSDSLQGRLKIDGRTDSRNGRTVGGRDQKWRLCPLCTDGASTSRSGWSGSEKVCATPIELQVGGNPFDRETLYYGALAELIVFERILGREEELQLESYLKEKYRL